MVLADVVELERRAAERDVSLRIDNLVRDDDVIRFECGDASLGILVGDKGRAKILEWLAASDVIEMAVAVNDVFDRRLSHRLDRVDIGLRRPPFTNRVGGDHARRRDDEHRLMAAITENVDIVRYFGGGKRRRGCLLGLRCQRAREKCRGRTCQVHSQHGRFSLMH